MNPGVPLVGIIANQKPTYEGDGSALAKGASSASKKSSSSELEYDKTGTDRDGGLAENTIKHKTK